MPTSQTVSRTTARKRDSNHGQSFLIVAALAGLLGISGFALGGATGLVAALALAGFLILSSSRASPALVLKMYKAKPIEGNQLPELQQMFAQLVSAAQLEHVPGLYYVPSKVMNAFAVGRGEQAAVAVTHGLLQQMGGREIAGVLAHELSHIKHKDLWVMGLADVFSRMTTVMGQIGKLMLLFSIPAFLLGMETAVPWLLLLVLIVAPTSSGLLQMALSRSREYEADAGAAHITGDPEGLASALSKIDQANTSWWKKLLFPGRKIPDPALLRTHPPTEERIERLLAMHSGNANQDRLSLAAQIPLTAASGQILPRPRWHLVSGLWY